MKPAVFFIEETKYKTEGKFKVDNYEIFELTRKNRDGGGLALGCLKSLHPVWVREGDRNVEALSIEIFVRKFKIRCCVAYGPQETDILEKKSQFWEYLYNEVSIAKHSGAGFILHFDGNLWAGNSIIPGDPRPQNRNGKMFQEFLQKNPNLTVVNSLPICEGVITRRRMKGTILEESILDFFVVCDRLLPHIKSMVIDSKKNHILTNYKPARKGGKAVDSDHMTEYLDLDIRLEPEKPVRQEMYNFKNKEAQKKFKILTSETKAFTACFDNPNKDILTQIEEWRKVLKMFCGKVFRKIRIKKQSLRPTNERIVKLVEERNRLSGNMDQQTIREKIKQLDSEISEIEALENRNKIIKNFKLYSRVFLKMLFIEFA